MKFSKMHPGNFIGKEDVDPPLRLTIKGYDVFTVEDDKGREVEKWGMIFEEEKRPFLLNVTNTDSIADIFGTPESDDTIGKQIELYFDPSVMFGKQKVGGVRLRKPE